MADLSKIKLNGVEYNLKDAAVPAWAKQETKPTYTASEVGALAKNSADNLYLSKGRASDMIESSTNDTLRLGYAHSTDGQEGRLQLSNAPFQNGYTTIIPTATTGISINLPSTEGTLALTSDITAAIGNINQFEVAIVTDLPTTDIDTHTIYFKSNSSSGNNVYDEYMYINNDWELIGSTAIDLSGYALSANLATVATSGDYNDLIDAPVAESDANVETMLNSFNLDYTNNTSSPNYAAGVNF